MKRDGKPKFKKDKGEQAMPDALPPPPPSEDAGAPPPQPEGGNQPSATQDGKPNKGKGKGKRDGGPPESCPEGTVTLEDGSCVTPQ
jgi:hypothetical protein